MGYASYVPKRREGPPPEAPALATVATVATLQPIETRSVANVATVADLERIETAEISPNVATVATVAEPSAATVDANDFEERAAILEYDEGLPRAEAEAKAGEELGIDGAGRLSAPADDWRTRIHVAGPGMRITAPAIEVSPGEYDAHLDLLIAVAGAGSTDANVLAHKKRKGNVVSRGDGLIFTRGR